MVALAVAALWKNEVRYDYYRAAAKTEMVQSIDEAAPDSLISFTGSMDQRLTIDGEYVESFTGYLFVDRHSEIYCWDEDEDDEGHTTWRRRWMNSVQSNSRNRQLSQTLSPGKFFRFSIMWAAFPFV